MTTQKTSQFESELELWCYNRALGAVTRAIVSVTGNSGPEYERAMRCVANTRELLGVSGYGNGGDRPRPGASALAQHHPPGMGEESRRLHQIYNTLVAAQRAGADNAADVRRVTDECADKGIVLIPGGHL